MEGSMSRLSFLIIFPFLPGCLAFGYPSATFTPVVESLPADVRAFKSTFALSGMSVVMTGGERFSLAVEEIPIKDGRLDCLQHAYFDYFVGGIPVSFFEHHAWKIILYRPGYDVIEVPSRWCGRKLLQARIDSLTWKPAQDIEAQWAALQEVCPEHSLDLVSPEVRNFVEQERARLTGLAKPRQ
jgi:hypothetical protein